VSSKICASATQLTLAHRCLRTHASLYRAPTSFLMRPEAIPGGRSVSLRGVQNGLRCEGEERFAPLYIWGKTCCLAVRQNTHLGKRLDNMFNISASYHTYRYVRYKHSIHELRQNRDETARNRYEYQCCGEILRFSPILCLLTRNDALKSVMAQSAEKDAWGPPAGSKSIKR
jgi:hypothetical protein